ncbi:MAG TPA: hypothetical protein VFB66_04910 [Tepidisphaeraceae bacterium]|nr:hypothetical protein [Tepidisphaeraceae bacterium]
MESTRSPGATALRNCGAQPVPLTKTAVTLGPRAPSLSSMVPTPSASPMGTCVVGLAYCWPAGSANSRRVNVSFGSSARSFGSGTRTVVLVVYGEKETVPRLLALGSVKSVPAVAVPATSSYRLVAV